jgi:hypothetical protein
MVFRSLSGAFIADFQNTKNNHAPQLNYAPPSGPIKKTACECAADTSVGQINQGISSQVTRWGCFVFA